MTAQKSPERPEPAPDHGAPAPRVGVERPLGAIDYEPPLGEFGFAAHAAQRRRLGDVITAQLAAVATGLDPRERVGLALPALLRAADLKVAHYRIKNPSAFGYGKYLLYSGRAGNQPFCVQLFVFAPGQKTPIHDHPCVCYSVVLRGEIVESRYHNLEYGVFPLNQRIRRAGDLGRLDPAQPNIHRLHNASAEPAYTVHLYFVDGIETPSAVETVYHRRLR